MPGTLVQDASGPVLLNSTTLTATVTGTAVNVGRPELCKAHLVVTGTVSGTTPTLDVEIQASDDITFATGVVSLGKFATVNSTSQTRDLNIDAKHKYLRAVGTVAGTTPSFGSVVCTVETIRFRRSKGETA